MRVDTAPFNDVRVRQAIRLVHGSQAGGPDRALRPGRRRPPTTTAASIPRPARASSATPDIEQAKSLLKAAGQAGPQGRARDVADLRGHRRGLPGARPERQGGGHRRSRSARSTSRPYFGGYGKWPFAVDYWVGLPYLVTASLNDGPGANVVNTTHFNDPEFNKLFNQAARTARRRQARARSSSACRRSSTTRGGNLIWSYQNTIDAYSKKVTGFTKVDQTGWGLGRCQLNRLSFV